jgi:polyisoprenoid-binding protein YceI
MILNALLATAFAGDYNLNGSLYIQVYKDPTTVAQALAHDHVVQAKAWSGKASYDPADPSTCNLFISVPVKSLEVDEKGLREQLGYDTFPSDGEREDIKAEMLGEKVLEGDKYPNITFQSTSCVADGDRVKVTGDMTIHGETKSVTVPMAVKADEVNFSAKGSIKIKSSDFGVPPYSAGFGALKNQDTMILVVSLHGKPKKKK